MNSSLHNLETEVIPPVPNPGNCRFSVEEETAGNARSPVWCQRFVGITKTVLQSKFWTGDTAVSSAAVPISGGDVSTIEIPLPILKLLDIASDGSALLLLSRDDAGTKLWSWPLTGGSPKVIQNDGNEAGWAPDRGTIAFGGDTPQLTLIGANGSRTVSSASQFGQIHLPRWSPDGARVNFTLVDPKDELSSLWYADFQGKHLHRVPRTAASGDEQANGSWTEDGRYFVYEAGSKQRHDLWAVPRADGFLASYFGKASRLTNGPMNWRWPVPGRSAHRVFALGESLRGELQRLDLATNSWRAYLAGIPAYEIDFSRDRKWIAYTKFSEHTIWKARIDGSERVQLTSAMFEAHQPHWSPDGSRIAFIAKKPGEHWRILTLDVSSGSAEELIPAGNDQGVATWSTDGQLVFGDWLFTNAPNAMNIHLYNGRGRRLSTVPGSQGLWTPRWSPDGAYLSALRANGSALLLTRCCFSQWKTLFEGQSLDDPMWSPDSKYVFYCTEPARSACNCCR